MTTRAFVDSTCVRSPRGPLTNSDELGNLPSRATVQTPAPLLAPLSMHPSGPSPGGTEVRPSSVVVVSGLMVAPVFASLRDTWTTGWSPAWKYVPPPPVAPVMVIVGVNSICLRASFISHACAAVMSSGVFAMTEVVTAGSVAAFTPWQVAHCVLSF